MQAYRQLVRYLKARLPEYRFSVRRVKFKTVIVDDHDCTDCGDTDKRKDGSFLIRINSVLDEDTARLVLLHELGHVLSWETDRHPSDHGPEWGKAHAKVWRLYQDWLAT